MNKFDSDYARVEAAIKYIEAQAARQPSLDKVAEYIGLSPYHFQRLFTRWAGVSPKRFLEYITVEAAKQLLAESASVLDAALDVGLSGPSRLHDLFVNAEAMTPGEFKRSGEGLEIRYCFGATAFGDCLVAASPRGLCSLEFLDAANPGAAPAALEALKRRWPNATFIADPAPCEVALSRLAPGAAPHQADSAIPAKTLRGQIPLRLHLRGTNFQLKVWQALLAIPEGRLVTYGKLAEMIGSPGSARAVGTALGQNPIGLLIPCHRVLRASGEIGGYKWGIERKKALIAYEASLGTGN
ncbi:MAG: methylated-DNA--[protein]-cysteine S-methyltransferase [Spirochaetales bacterium]|jgi:AraC family transcriptional regulator of adaptative response/methylated-DNA-[protein]-cysteine methyltransferase